MEISSKGARGPFHQEKLRAASDAVPDSEGNPAND
jgi:hypothetical protein